MNKDLKIAITAITDIAGNLLMIRRSHNPDDENSGKWECPAGHIDPGEIPSVAAVREVKEETGLDIFLIPHGIIIPTKRGKAAYYLGFVQSGKEKPPVKLAPDEHDRHIWVKPKDFDRVQPTHKRMKENLIDLLTHVSEKLHVPEKTAQKVVSHCDYWYLARQYEKIRRSASGNSSWKSEKPVTLDLYRAEETPDKAKRDRVPHQFAVGQYWSTSEDVAATYGDSVTHNKITLKNPYVLNLGDGPYWTDLQREFKTRDPQEITHILKSKGHDSLIVTNVPVNRFRRDTGEGVAMRDSVEVILFSPISMTKREEQPMKTSRRAKAKETISPEYAYVLPGPGEELKEAILVGDEVEIFLKKHVNNDGKTPEPSISGVVEKRDRNTIWVHAEEDGEEQVVPVNWDDRGDWAFVRVYRGPDQVVYFAAGNPYDEDSKEVSKAKGLGLILESEPPTRYESVWALMRGETPDLDRSMGQAPEGTDVVYPTNKPKPGTPDILTQVQSVIKSHGFEPDMVSHLGKGRVMVLTQDSDLKKELIKVLEKHGKKVESSRHGYLIVRQGASLSTMGTTTVPIATDDDLMLLTRKKRERDLQEQKRQSAAPAAPITPAQAQMGQQGLPVQQVPILQPNVQTLLPKPQNQVKQIEQQVGGGKLPSTQTPAGTVVTMTPQQAQKYYKTQQNPATNQALKKPAVASRQEILRVARSLAQSLRDQEYDSSSQYISQLRGMGVKEASITRSSIASRKAWGHLHRYLEATGEIENSRIARTASRLAPDL